MVQWTPIDHKPTNRSQVVPKLIVILATHNVTGLPVCGDLRTWPKNVLNILANLHVISSLRLYNRFYVPRSWEMAQFSTQW